MAALSALKEVIPDTPHIAISFWIPDFPSAEHAFESISEYRRFDVDPEYALFANLLLDRLKFQEYMGEESRGPAAQR